MSILKKYTDAIDKKDETTMNELLHDDFKFTMHKSGNTIGRRQRQMCIRDRFNLFILIRVIPL